MGASPYRTLFYETNFWTYFQSTIIVSAVTTLIVLVAGVVGAYSLTRYAFRGRTLAARVTLQRGKATTGTSFTEPVRGGGVFTVVSCPRSARASARDSRRSGIPPR